MAFLPRGCQGIRSPGSLPLDSSPRRRPPFLPRLHEVESSPDVQTGSCPGPSRPRKRSPTCGSGETETCRVLTMPIEDLGETREALASAREKYPAPLAYVASELLY